MSDEFTVEESGAGERLDVYLIPQTGLTRSYIRRLIDEGHITLNGAKVKSGTGLKLGDLVSVTIPPPVSLTEPEDLPLDIIYEDGSVAVINKRQGTAVHAGGGIRSGTLVNALMFRLKNLSSINGELRPGIVHRLDKDTSGVMAVAKTNAAHLNLSGQIARRETEKLYRAVLEGTPKTDSGRIKTLIGRSPSNRKLMEVCSNGGREAITEYRVLESFKANSYVEFKLLTGRTHQIRVHAKYIGHPIVGDTAYGFKKQRFKLGGQLLHAYKLEFTHPDTGGRVDFTAPLPDYFERILEILRNESKE
jgi:23S rRNA pseudouridine1911/1915/1917 synthase